MYAVVQQKHDEYQNIWYFISCFLCSFALFMIRSDHMIWWYYIMWRYHVAPCGKTTKRKRKCHGIVVLPLAQSHQHPMINLEFLIRIHDVDVIIQHFNEKNSGKKIICIAEIFNFLCYPVKLNHVQAAAKQMHFSDRKKKQGRKKKKEKTLASLQMTWRGLLLLCAKMGRIAAVEIPFCETTIYNLAIDLFMCLHRLSLDATGHVWEGNVFMALFLISQAIFLPPLHSESMAFKLTRRGRLS